MRNKVSTKAFSSVVYSSMTIVACIALLVSFASGTSAQDNVTGPPALQSGLGDLGQFGSPLGGDEEKLTISARYKLNKNGKEGKLFVTATSVPGWHFYSVTQPDGGPQKTEIKLVEPKSIKFVGVPKSSLPPAVKPPDVFPVNSEEHHGTITWTIALDTSAGIDSSKPLKVAYIGQVCADDLANGGCIPIEQTLMAEFDGEYGGAAEFKVPSSRATLTGYVERIESSSGSDVSLKFVVEAKVEEKFYIYEYAPYQLRENYFNTIISFDLAKNWNVADIASSSEPEEKKDVNGEPLRYHPGKVSWTTVITIPGGNGKEALTGSIGLQTCKKAGCDPPTAAAFEVTIPLDELKAGQRLDLSFSEGDNLSYTSIAEKINKTRDLLADLNPDIKESKLSYTGAFLIALLGGFLLNFMPCVLPVIGLKIMSFVGQAGESSSRVFMLNLWYSLGLLSVFMVLATLAVGLGFAWGEQNQNFVFNITMASVVFVMGLSFVGVWEIPIPGFVGAGKAAAAAEKEGPSGAFIKGIVTTIMAVPCSGPGLGTALFWTSDKPALVTFGIFATLALGMALPYLIIGANPSLIRFLPKPGAWMETFKQSMGFLLLGTVVYIFSYIPQDMVIPSLCFMLGLGFACWMIGRIPVTADSLATVRGYMLAFAVIGAMGLFSFKTLTAEPEHKLPWEEFSTTALAEKLGKETVMVDFTADWCPTCKVLERTVLNTEAIKGFVTEHNVKPMLADWTDKNEEIGTFLKRFNADAIPVLAIFPKDRPNKPIVLINGYTQSTLLEKLEQATATGSEVASAGL